jgi:DNA-binding response OmpR family regulator
MTQHSGDSPQSLVLLVVEEDDGVRELLETAMSIQGFEVLSCINGMQALDIYRREADRIKLILMDVNMEGLSGSETLDELRRMNQHVRCCFMSGDTSGSDWPALLQRGALCVFTKPFPSMLKLAETLKHYATSSN